MTQKKWKRASVIVSNPCYVPRPNQQQVDQSVNGCSNIVDSNGQFCNIQSKQKSLPAPPEKKHNKGPAPKLNGDETCTICAAHATGFHYNVLSCEGCKNFFRRAIVHGLVYHCKTSIRDCSVKWDHRPRCQWCRLDKCKTSGMKPEYINRTKSNKKGIPKNVRIYLNELEKHWENATKSPLACNTKNPPYMNMNVAAESDENDHIVGIEADRLDFFLEMAYHKTKRIIKFMHGIKGFEKLSATSRVWFFKNSLAETMVLFNATSYDPERKIRQSTVPAVRWLDGVWRGADDFSKCSLTEIVIEQMFDIWKRIHDLKLDQKACALMMALVIVNQDRDISRPVKKDFPMIANDLPLLNQIEDHHLEALRIYLEDKFGKKSVSKILGKVFSIMSSLRNITNLTLPIQLAQLEKVEAKMPQLLAVLFSFDTPSSSSSN